MVSSVRTHVYIHEHRYYKNMRTHATLSIVLKVVTNCPHDHERCSSCFRPCVLMLETMCSCVKTMCPHACLHMSSCLFTCVHMISNTSPQALGMCPHGLNHKCSCKPTCALALKPCVHMLAYICPHVRFRVST